MRRIAILAASSFALLLAACPGESTPDDSPAGLDEAAANDDGGLSDASTSAADAVTDAALPDRALADADANADAADRCSDGGVCNGSGLCAPIPACSPSSPCTTDAGTQTTVLPALDCKTDPASTTRPIFDDNPARAWTDAVTAEPRGACVFHPAGASAALKRPLVLYFHGSGSVVQNLYDTTLIRAKAAAFDLTGDVARPGFHLTFEQGRVLPNPNGNLGPAARRDIYFRDYASPSTNPDVRNADRLIDELVAIGDVDPKRIYVMGWSNGAFFGAAYAVARHETATPGGNRVAAAAVYAGADPFQEFEPGQTECRLAPRPTTDLPILLVNRSCDSAVGCNAAQQTKFAQPPGYDSTAWLTALQGSMGNPNAQRLLVAPNGSDAIACQTALGCGQVEGLVAHVRWPDGVADGSGIDREPAMLAFLRAHPLP